MKYSVILADPPWEFKTWSLKGKGKSADRHYPIMKIEDVCALPVKDITGDNAALFLWTTWPTIMKYAPMVMEAWGFTYRTDGFIWIKRNRKGNGTFMGTGYYTRANSEPCLLCVKGRMPVANRGVSQVIIEPVGEHSRKPDLYSRIELLYPGVPKLELFARQAWPGWDNWGFDAPMGVWDLTKQK